MLPSHRIPTHPGEILLEEFLRPLGTSQLEFSRQLRVPLQRVNEIVRGKRGITAETALLLAARLGTSPEFWLNLQAACDLGRARAGVSRERLHSLETVRRRGPIRRPAARSGQGRVAARAGKKRR